MKISEHMQILQDMVDENPNSLGIMLPVDSVNALLKYSADRERIQKKYSNQRTRASWYKEQYEYVKAELGRKNELITNQRQADG